MLNAKEANDLHKYMKMKSDINSYHFVGNKPLELGLLTQYCNSKIQTVLLSHENRLNGGKK